MKLIPKNICIYRYNASSDENHYLVLPGTITVLLGFPHNTWANTSSGKSSLQYIIY